MGFSQILMEDKFHGGVHVRNLSMCSGTETVCCGIVLPYTAVLRLLIKMAFHL